MVCCLRTFLTIFLFSQYYLVIIRVQVKIFMSPSVIKMQIKAELQTANWDDVAGHSDPNSAYENFWSKYIASYNKCFPLKKVKARNGYFNKPWLSKGLLKSIKRKNILYKRYLCKPSSDRENQYKKYRNKLTCSLLAAKRISVLCEEIRGM